MGGRCAAAARGAGRGGRPVRARAPGTRPTAAVARALLSAEGVRRHRQSSGDRRGVRTCPVDRFFSDFANSARVMPMAAIHTYQTLGMGQKLTQLQVPAPRRLAPAPVDPARCKKRSYLHQPYQTQPASVARRNARERNRVKQVNNGFAALRQHIPSAVTAALAGGRGSSRKLSKVDTLRLAVEYIKSLKRLLDETEEGCSESTSGLTLSAEIQTPPSSEASHSPAPSLVSEGSAGPGSHDAYDSYDPMSPEDEELLDVISWWQQQ